MECHAKIVIEANCVVNYSRVREKEREKMVKGNDGCGMKQAKKKRQQNWNTISNRTADCVKNGC